MVGKSHYRVRGVKCGKCERIHTWYKYRVWREGEKIKEEYIGRCDKSGNMHTKNSSKQQKTYHQHSKQQTYTYPRRSRSPYEILGIHYFATNEEIKRAYRTLVKQYHPDIHKHIDPRVIVEINTAYHILMK